MPLVYKSNALPQQLRYLNHFNIFMERKQLVEQSLKKQTFFFKSSQGAFLTFMAKKIQTFIKNNAYKEKSWMLTDPQSITNPIIPLYKYPIDEAIHRTGAFNLYRS